MGEFIIRGKKMEDEETGKMGDKKARLGVLA